MKLNTMLKGIEEKLKIHYLFLIIAIPFGIYWSILLPQFQAPDEAVHIYRAYEISEGHFLSKHVDGKTGDFLPTSILEFVETSGLGELPFNYHLKVQSEKINAAKEIKLSNERSFYSFPSSAIYSPLPYLPQALGMFIGRILDLPIYYILLVSRWCNLLAYVVLSFYAIKLIPRLKRFLFILALMPMTVHQVSSLSADASTFGFAFLLSAYIFRLIFSSESQKIRRKDVAILLCLTVALTLCKSAYFTYFLLVFLIPVSKFLNKKQYWVYNSLVSIANPLILFIWMQLCKNTEMATDPVSQLKTILLHPLSFLKKVIGTFIYDDAIYLQFFGVFGWLDTPIPYIISYLLIVFLTIAFTSEERLESENKETYIRGTILFLFFLIQAAIVVTMLYLGFPQTNPKMVIGVQGRYFIPIFLILAFGMYVLYPLLKKRYTVYFIVVVISLAISSYFMYIRFYI
ncbi:DUF2142 domain-containing protein [Bacillus sp. 1P10SD]|uniref:DUF2142 domain-containing protein n=1 Tax=Bacillus sp. 1P10SD TaxID=3132265 RepID=UPI0039A441DC